jgi:pimeloyl-ACP methyl ester carboxylesterase
MDTSHRRATTPVLEIAYESANEDAADTVILLHGFPYDTRAYRDVVPLLAAEGLRVIVPSLRGFGDTRFLSDDTLRSGQQAALGRDLVELMDAVGIASAVVAGYDWGGRAACIAAALNPERIAGLVTVDGYNIQEIAASVEPVAPEWESTYWYQYYFQTERGRRGLERNRDELCALLWRTWSPAWAAAADEFALSAASLHNPDFVDVVIHSYRHRFGLVAGDPLYATVEEQLAAQPVITVPTIVLEPGADGIGGPSSAGDAPMFTGPYEHRLLPGIGHNTPQEAPELFARAVLDVRLL